MTGGTKAEDKVRPGSFPLRCLIRCWISALQMLSQGLMMPVPVSGDTENSAIHTAHGTSGTARDFCGYCKQITPFLVFVTHKCLTCLYPTDLQCQLILPARNFQYKHWRASVKTNVIQLVSRFTQPFLLSWPRSGLKKKSASLSPFDNWENRQEKGQKRFPTIHVPHRTSSPLQHQPPRESTGVNSVLFWSGSWSLKAPSDLNSAALQRHLELCRFPQWLAEPPRSLGCKLPSPC